MFAGLARANSDWNSTMPFEDEISNAIGAHGVWKMRLRTSIDSGKADGDPVGVGKDNYCAFGKWLHGSTISATARASADYATVTKLHADFHKCAAKVLGHVQHGQREQANSIMTTEYTKVSFDLTAALRKWKAATH
jgi:hypothetical protein